MGQIDHLTDGPQAEERDEDKRDIGPSIPAFRYPQRLTRRTRQSQVSVASKAADNLSERGAIYLCVVILAPVEGRGMVSPC